jgi:hypothetical protein
MFDLCMLDARTRVGGMRPDAHATVARAPLRRGGHMRRRATGTMHAQSTTHGEPAKKRAVVIGRYFGAPHRSVAVRAVVGFR